jgi:hypothetical protein
MNTFSCPRSLLSCLGLSCVTGLLLDTSSAAAADEVQLRHVRACDTSACYYAWNVVDSDGDGYSDADEVAAGCDPFDSADRPSLEVIVDLIGTELLPTFEFGVGQIIVFPAEYQAMLELAGASPLAAFPLGDRKSAFDRAGIDAGLLAEHGLDAEFGGFTLTLGSSSDGNAPPRLIGGVDVSLISAEDGDDEVPGNVVVDIIHEDDASTTYVLDNGDTVHHKVDGTAVRKDKDGNVIIKSFVNPDADGGSAGEVTEETYKALERLRNAAIRTVAGWSKIAFDQDDIQDRRKTIILIDPDYVENGQISGQVSGPPQIDKAQPETRPDLPNPLVQGGGCTSKC